MRIVIDLSKGMGRNSTLFLAIYSHILDVISLIRGDGEFLGLSFLDTDLALNAAGTDFAAFTLDNR